MSGSREAQLDGWGTSREIEREIAALSVTEKAPEQSGKPTRGWSAQAVLFSSYGDPVLEWWRPGGSGLAVTDQGSQAYLSLAATLRGR